MNINNAKNILSLPRTPVLIINNAEGGLCNQLTLLAHALANIYKSEGTIIHPFISEYLQYLPNLRVVNSQINIREYKYNGFAFSKFISLVMQKKKFRLLLLKLFALLPWDFQIINWDYKDYKLLEIYKLSILENLQFTQETIGEGNDIIRAMRENMKGVCLVGVHMRRGDYKRWSNGKYYYNDAEYIKIIQRCKSIFDGSSHFILFSDEPISNSFLDLGKITIVRNNLTVDLTVMSLCNYLIGPPSTFSGWASFLGSVPIHFVEDVGRQFKKDDFNVCST